MSLAVGIDVGAYKCAVAVCREGEREAERKVLSITTQRGGFTSLDEWMAKQGAPIDVVVMESSGHYWFNLASHLRRRGYPVAVVNPLQAKYFAKSRLQRSKSDPADARTLAALGTHDQPRIGEPLVGAELKEAARFAMRLVREQAQVCQRIQRLVDIGFPELREVWDDPTCVSALAVLRHAPTATAVARMHQDRLARLKRPGSGGRVVGPMKAAQLKQLAQTSVAAPELEQQVRFEMRLLIAQHDLLDQQIASADARVASLLDGEVSQRLLSIPGVGPSTAATLMAEIGDIWRFNDVDQLLAYAGVHPKEQSSGKKGAIRRRVGPSPRPAMPTCVRPHTGWPWWASSTTRSSVPITPANALPASPR
ncbi:MAG TPA: IS110 family transposase [Solirubrobacteraceae bacterium]|nr:IS110 family transposase [Solirubrobacteraceae bacterium]